MKIREKKESELIRPSSNTNVNKKTIQVTKSITTSHSAETKKLPSKDLHIKREAATDSSSNTAYKTDEAAKPSSSSIFSFESSPSKRYGKSKDISGEDIHNFVSAITKLGYDAAQLVAAAGPSHIDAEPIKKETNSVYSSENMSKTTSENDEHLSSADEHSRAKSEKNFYCSSNRMQHSSESSNPEANTDSDASDETEHESEETQSDEPSNSEDEEYMIESRESKELKLSKRATFSSRKSTDKSSKPLFSNDGKLKNKKFLDKSGKNKSQMSRKLNRNKQMPQRCKRNSTSKNLNESEQAVTLSLKENKVKLEPTQCLGPDCTLEAMKESKYCSEECGLNLAKNRLIHFLKSRLEQYNETTSFSKILNESELERINSEIESLRVKLKNLEKKHLELDNIINRAKHELINPFIEVSRLSYLLNCFGLKNFINFY